MQPPRLEIDIPTQRLDLLIGDQIVFTAPVSTARNGTGTAPGSLCTPTGRFIVAEKIGAGLAPGSVLRGRVPTGETLDPESPEDQITSRILWLEGLDPENSNTRERYIYIHGTNQESHLGQPVSHGCIRLGNREIIELFDLVPENVPVLIR